MNFPTIVVLALLAVAVFFAARHIWKKKGGCVGCSDCGEEGGGCCCCNSSVDEVSPK